MSSFVRILTIVIAIWGGVARADFQWSGAWQSSPLGTGPSSVTPGVDLSNGGSITSTAAASISIDINGNFVGNASAGRSITRSFTLSESPLNGWTINTTAGYTGTIQSLHAIASATMIVQIDGVTLDSFGSNTGGGGIPFPISGVRNNNVTRADGLHTISLTLQNSTFFPGPPISGPGSFASITADYSFSITTSLTPVPEPATFCLGLGALAAYSCRRLIRSNV